MYGSPRLLLQPA